MPNYQDFTDPDLLATAGWKEARGEIHSFGNVAMLAIMHVMVNRKRDWKWTLQHVILGPNQITSMSVPSDPEFNLVPSPSDPCYVLCLGDAGGILDGSDPDETNGAHWYANLDHIDPGGWFGRHIVQDPNNHPLTVKIGGHSFFV